MNSSKKERRETKVTGRHRNPDTALVTGGAVRIGRAICERLAAKGFAVAIHFNRSEQAARELQASLQADGATAYLVRGPLSSEAEAERIMESACRQAGSIEVLVNNAAIFNKQSLRDAGEHAFEEMWRINALGPMMLTRAFAARRRDGERGVVINLLDRRVAATEGGCLPYLLSKKMLAEFTRNAALELAPSIRVNAVAPGAVLPPPRSRESIRDLAGDVPLDCDCPPASVADAVTYLVEAETITGQILFVDGGRHLRP